MKQTALTFTMTSGGEQLEPSDVADLQPETQERIAEATTRLLPVTYYCGNEQCEMYRRDSGRGDGLPPSKQPNGHPPCCRRCVERLYYTQPGEPIPTAARGVGRRDYAERRAARIARLERRAEKLREESASRLGAARRLGDAIPFGQPILVGHHSEKRHRRDIERIDTNMRKGFQAQKEADRCDSRVAAAESNRAISSDDPEAVVRLKEKLAKLEHEQTMMKAINAVIRKHIKKGSLVAQQALLKEFSEMGQIQAEQLCTPDFCGRIGYPDYRTKNNGAEIRRCEKRIAQLQRAAALPEIDEEIGVVRVRLADNRVQLHFPGKPAELTRKTLKENGFRWAPTEGAWQRHASHYALDLARRIARSYSEAP